MFTLLPFAYNWMNKWTRGLYTAEYIVGSQVGDWYSDSDQTIHIFLCNF